MRTPPPFSVRVRGVFFFFESFRVHGRVGGPAPAAGLRLWASCKEVAHRKGTVAAHIHPKATREGAHTISLKLYWPNEYRQSPHKN